MYQVLFKIEQNNKIKRSKVLIDKKYYLYKVITGRKDYIQQAKHILDRRLIDINKSMNVLNRQVQIKVQRLQKEQYNLCIISPWIEHQDVIKIISQINDNNKKMYMKNTIICQIIVEIFIGPNNFIYSYDSILHNSEKGQIFFNYYSLCGEGFMKASKQISRKQYCQGLDSLVVVQEQLISLKLKNKFRAVGCLILNILLQQHLSSQQQIKDKQFFSLQEITEFVKDYQNFLKDKIIESNQLIQQIQQFNQANYHYFFEYFMFEGKEKVKWTDLIICLIPKFILPQSAKQDQSLQKIISKIGIQIYNRQDKYLQQKLRELGIIQEQPYQLYLKFKLASSKQELLFLFKLSKLVHLFHLIFQEEDCKIAQNIFKSLLSLVYQINPQEEDKEKQADSTSDPKKSKAGLNEELRLIQNRLLSKCSIFTVSFKQTQVNYLSYEGRMLKRYKNL